MKQQQQQQQQANEREKVLLFRVANVAYVGVPREGGGNNTSPPPLFACAESETECVMNLCDVQGLSLSLSL